MAGCAPLVAIVTPVYNGASHLAETMECVQAQTYPRILHIVLDNASTDGTPAIINTYKNRRIPVVSARHVSTLPIIENWNAAVRMIGPGASYFRVLPADDLISPDGIEKMVAIGEANPEVNVIGCQEWTGGFVRGTELPRDHSIFDGRCIVRGSLLNSIHGFPHVHCLFRIPDKGLPGTFYEAEFHGEPLLGLDMDAAMRELSKGCYAYVHEPLVTTRLHSGSITATQFAPNHMKMWSELQLIDRWGPVVFDSPADYSKCRARHLRFYYRYLLFWRLRRKLALYEKHLTLLRKASAEPTTSGYAIAAMEWPIVRALRRLKRLAVLLGMPAYRFEII